MCCPGACRCGVVLLDGRKPGIMCTSHKCTAIHGNCWSRFRGIPCAQVVASGWLEVDRIRVQCAYTPRELQARCARLCQGQLIHQLFCLVTITPTSAPAGAPDMNDGVQYYDCVSRLHASIPIPSNRHRILMDPHDHKLAHV